jgi:hypothetical protein
MIRTDDELTMLSYNVNQVLNTNQQNTKVKGDRLGLSSVNRAQLGFILSLDRPSS